MLQGIRRVGRRSDEALSAIAARGDRGAFEAVYERHHEALYRYCFSILGHHEDASDAVHNAMLKAWQALLSGGPKAPLRPWLFRIAHNEAITVIRRRRTHGQLEDVSMTARSVEETLDTRLRVDRLRADLEAMPTRQRSALLLRELCGLRHDEIAAVLDVSAATARQTIYEARVALHEAEAGRQLACEIVRRTLSDGDGRVRRGRRIRSHLRACAGCASFDEALRRRPGELAGLTPLLPGTAVAGLLARFLGAQGASGGGASTAGAMAAGMAGAVTTISQVAAVVATTVTVGTAAAGGVGAVIELQRAATPPRVKATATAGAGTPAADRARIESRPALVAGLLRPSRAPARESAASAARGPATRPVATRAPSPSPTPGLPGPEVRSPAHTAQAKAPAATSRPEPVRRQDQARSNAPAAPANATRPSAQVPAARRPEPRPLRPRPIPGGSSSVPRPSTAPAGAPAAGSQGASSRPRKAPPANVPSPALASRTADGPPTPPRGTRAPAGASPPASAGPATEPARSAGASSRPTNSLPAVSGPSRSADSPREPAPSPAGARGPSGGADHSGQASGVPAQPGPPSGA
jgi:RNA polymerase sigma factor (sigma-70 family)